MPDFKPMLAGTLTDVSKLRFPVLASPKLDGIRAMVHNGVLVSRNLKPIPNKYVQELFTRQVLGKTNLEGLDGELVFGDPTAPDAFRATTSAVMRIEGEPGVVFYAFDSFITPGVSYQNRLVQVEYAVRHHPQSKRSLRALPHTVINTVEELDRYEAWYLSEGYEGVMIRSLDGLYKFGRSTEREGALLKVKRFEDAEAEVLSVEERMHNANAATRDALGRVERSSHKANKHGTGMFGAFKVRVLNGPYVGVTCNVASGRVTDVERVAIWEARRSWVGRTIKFRYFPGGSKTAPRFPVFLGERTEGDMS